MFSKKVYFSRFNITDPAAAPVSPFTAGVFMAGASGGCCCFFSVPDHGGEKMRFKLYWEKYNVEKGSAAERCKKLCGRSQVFVSLSMCKA